MKKILFIISSILLMAILLEGLSYLGMFYLKSKKNISYNPSLSDNLTATQRKNIQKLLNGEEKYITHNPTLGWTIKPNGQASVYQSNAQGIRADHEYALQPPANKIRIATFGDSFVHCDEVHNNETWQEHLNKLDPILETINFGVGGFGQDQAYLRYQIEGKKFKPDIVLIGFISENAFRNLNIFRPFYNRNTQLPMTKPRYKLINNQLHLIDNPLSTLSDYQNLLDNEKKVISELMPFDYNSLFRYKPHTLDFLRSIRLIKVLRSRYYKSSDNILAGPYFNTDSQFYKITYGILEMYYKSVVTEGSTPIVMFIPSGWDYTKLKSKGIKSYKPIVEEFEHNGWNYIDLTERLITDPRNKNHKELFAPNGHLSAVGNQRIAEYIYDYLKTNSLIEKKKKQ